jgi:ABC-type multidrug transport system permease subunit
VFFLLSSIAVLFYEKLNEASALYLMITIGFIWNIYCYNFIKKRIDKIVGNEYLKSFIEKIYNRKTIRIFIYSTYTIALIITNINVSELLDNFIESDYRNAIIGSFATFVAIERVVDHWMKN